jgi:outer membrane protein assembly factor BamB
MKRLFPTAVLLTLLSFLFALTATAAQNWPQFRGPGGDGHSSSKNLPLKWSETENVTWKVPVHDRGWSSPVIWGNQIWLTTASEDGKKLHAVCINKKTGKTLYDKQLFEIADPQFAHKFNSYASPSPVIEKGRVYITFGSPGTACIDTKTFKTLWTREDLVCDHFRGAGSSPIIHKNLLINNYDGADVQFALAFDKNTGKTIWRTDRSIDYDDIDPKTGKPLADGDWRKAYATCHIANFGDGDILISQGAKANYAYDPMTGKELWRFEEKTCHSAANRPVIGDGLIYFTTGFSKPFLVALKPGGKGLLGEKDVAWSTKRGASKKPSLTLANGLIFVCEDGGIANCLDAKTGEVYWNERIRDNHSASPLYANGRIYMCSEKGKTMVLNAGKEFKVLATNMLADGFMSSPAVSGNALFLRTTTHLYRIENKK